MGFTFLGETLHGEHWVIADVRIKNLDKSVCCSADSLSLRRLTQLSFTRSFGTCGVTSRTRCEQDKLSKSAHR